MFIFFFKIMLLASLATILAIYILRPIATNIKLLDVPSKRKNHEGHVPLIGGIAIFLAMVVTILLSPVDLNGFNYFLITSLIILLGGVIDDHSNISVKYRLILQIIAALIMVSFGEVSLDSFGNLLGYGEILLNEWSMIISIFAILAAINAVNMADGIHGLAGGNSFVSFLAISFLAINNSSQFSLIICLIFCAVLPVFLVNNLCIGMSSSKRIFLGDAGSMFIGISLSWVLFDFTQGDAPSFSPVIALWLIAFPLLELSCTVLRRLTSGVSPFNPDSSHTHHLLIKLGFNETTSLITLLVFSITMATIGIIGELYAIDEYLMFIGFLFVFMCYYIASKLALKKIDNLS
jgi:UDP-GlcNAc:undecaprenyl-phosphate GlcNAc-1-phosphate transferase